MIYDFILAEEADYKTKRIPVTGSVDWNMFDHIERCTNVANGWYHTGNNDGMRPYRDIVTPIVNVAIRSEGFDVKHIVPYVNDISQNYKSFLVKKYHPQWARKNHLDTFIDELVYSSVVYDLAVVKNVNSVRPEIVPLQSIAFCDQTNFLTAPFGIKHQYSPSQLLKMSNRWDKDKIEEAIVMAKAEKSVKQANDKKVKTTGKYIEVYEVHGDMPANWLDPEDNSEEYVNQMHIVCFYTSEDGSKNGITLFKGKNNKQIFKTLVVNPVFGRACGKSIVETLFEPQVWTNYSAIKIKEMLDAAAIMLLQTDSDELGNQKISKLKNNTVLKHEDGKPITTVNNQAINLTAFTNHQTTLENDARILGSASEGALGINPTAGTPFALQALIVQEGQGIHQFRQGKISTFMAEEIYPEWIIPALVKDMNGGKDFSEELTLDEMQEIAEQIAKNEIEKKIQDSYLKGKAIYQEQRDEMIAEMVKTFLKSGSRQFFKVLERELDSLPVDVYVNIVGKQKGLAQNVDKITNIVRQIISNPQAFQQIPGLGKLFNQLIEESGLNPIDFTQIVNTPMEQLQVTPQEAPLPEAEMA